MTGPAILNALFGAALVAIGVLAAALADRIRGLRVSRDRATATARTTPSRAPIEVIAAEIEPAPPRAASKSKAAGGEPRAEVRWDAGHKAQAMAYDVIAALIAAGYKKSIAEEAVWGCNAAERATVETWAASALRRCARGGMA